jgi:hypothetical protein
MKWLDTTNDKRTWIFRLLVVAAIVLTLVSFSMPWWMTDGTASSGSFFIRIYGYGLQHNMDSLQEYIAADETPAYQTALAWAYVGVSAVIALLATWLRGKKGMFLLGTVGLGYIAYALAAVFMVVKNRLVDSGIALQGITSTGLYKQVGMSFDSSITAGFYLALAAGAAFIVLSLLRNVIRKSTSTSCS